MDTISQEQVKHAVRSRYARAAQDEGCGCAPSCCGGAGTRPDARARSRAMGYAAEELASVPEGANLGLGCGNPQGIAALKAGETVLDLGSGAGFDCFLAARQVGDSGHVIGVDMTPEMISRACANAEQGGYRNVEFRLAEIESLPVADASVDVIISNCVVNLSPDKPRVYAQAWRVLKPGGRLAISDVVATATLPDHIRRDLALHAGCVAGASLVADIEAMLRAAGFEQVRVTPKDESRTLIRNWAPGNATEDYVVSALIQAVKSAPRAA
jgi:SAM-dependent methyltransferase